MTRIARIAALLTLSLVAVVGCSEEPKDSIEELEGGSEDGGEGEDTADSDDGPTVTPWTWERANRHMDDMADFGGCSAYGFDFKGAMTAEWAMSPGGHFRALYVDVETPRAAAYQALDKMGQYMRADFEAKYSEIEAEIESTLGLPDCMYMAQDVETGETRTLCMPGIDCDSSQEIMDAADMLESIPAEIDEHIAYHS